MSEWGASLTGVGTYGEWANVSVYPDFPNEEPGRRGACVRVCVFMCVCVCAFVGTSSSFSTLCSTAPGLSKHVEGIIVGASVVTIVLVAAFILLTVAAGYYYYRKNKVVIVKVCMAWVTYIVYITVYDITQYSI